MTPSITPNITLASPSEALEIYKRGEMVIIVDDADRENEGDLTIATEFVTPEKLAFMMSQGRGLICVSISKDQADKLRLPFQVRNNNSKFQTPFAVSVDYKGVGDLGITAKSRATTCLKLIDDLSTPADFNVPGHIFPLVAHTKGVLGRQGQTEASYDCSRLVGLKPSGIICEILNPDGTMARGDSLERFSNKHKIPIISVEQIIKYRLSSEAVVRQVAEANLNTEYGIFRTVVFENEVDGKEHLALIKGEPWHHPDPIVRVHSECLTGDVFGSRRCDCGNQLQSALKDISSSGCGVLLYLRQEGRGIGLTNKLRAYELQDHGHDTVEANIKLGFAADSRDFMVAAKMLISLGVKNLRLLTNNPVKIETLSRYGINVISRVPSIYKDTLCKEYLETKRDRLGHMIE